MTHLETACAVATSTWQRASRLNRLVECDLLSFFSAPAFSSPFPLVDARNWACSHAAMFELRLSTGNNILVCSHFFFARCRDANTTCLMDTYSPASDIPGYWGIWRHHNACWNEDNSPMTCGATTRCLPLLGASEVLAHDGARSIQHGQYSCYLGRRVDASPGCRVAVKKTK